MNIKAENDEKQLCIDYFLLSSLILLCIGTWKENPRHMHGNTL